VEEAEVEAEAEVEEPQEALEVEEELPGQPAAQPSSRA